MLLEDKVAIVTGAARGTGAAIARRAAAEGAAVVVTDIDEVGGAAVAAEIGAHFERLDVTVAADWERVVGRTVARAGRVDTLVNNAAVLHIGGLADTDGNTFRRLLDVNLVGPHLGARAVVPAMEAGGGGAIVNVASLDALVGMNGLSAYAASKWGLRGLTKSLALELGRAGIRVNTVCPAGGNPAMFAPWGEGLGGLGDALVHYLGDRAIPREADLDEIAWAVVFLASDHARFVTGVDLPVDGGHSAGSYLAGFDRL